MQPELPFEFWIDMNLPPSLAEWISTNYQFPAKSFYELGFATTDDAIIFNLARKSPRTIVITTKDIDFVNLVEVKGHPPKILYVNTGNITKTQLLLLFEKSFEAVIKFFKEDQQTFIEITNKP